MRVQDARGSTAMRPRARSVSTTPLLSVPRTWLTSARETGCSWATMASTSRAAWDSGSEIDLADAACDRSGFRLQDGGL
jgi:hypothetical protein